VTDQQHAAITFDTGTEVTLASWSIDHYDRRSEISGWIPSDGPELPSPHGHITRAVLPGAGKYCGLDVAVDITSYGLPSRRRFLKLTWPTT
jgi:hypothetical protein